MLVSFLQALLNMLRKELDSFSAIDVDPTKQLAGVSSGPDQPAIEKPASQEIAASTSADGSTGKGTDAPKPPASAPSRRRARRKPGR
jgi:hypothetical protein